MATIEVQRTKCKNEAQRTNPSTFRVQVIESSTRTTHDATLKQDDYMRLTGGKIEPEELVRRSLEFLLEREPKESILVRFDLSVIGRYFPEYEREMKRRSSKS